MESKKLGKTVSELIRNLVADSDLELVHVNVVFGEGRQLVQIFIDKEEGITHDDCVFVSQHVEKYLDADDLIKEGYDLEVSSPGIERGLYKVADFERFLGEQARIATAEPINGQRNFRGVITGVEGENIVFEDVTKETVTINFNQIKNANLVYDAAQELKAGRRKERKARRK